MDISPVLSKANRAARPVGSVAALIIANVARGIPLDQAATIDADSSSSARGLERMLSQSERTEVARLAVRIEAEAERCALLFFVETLVDRRFRQSLARALGAERLRELASHRRHARSDLFLEVLKQSPNLSAKEIVRELERRGVKLTLSPTSVASKVSRLKKQLRNT